MLPRAWFSNSIPSFYRTSKNGTRTWGMRMKVTLSSEFQTNNAGVHLARVQRVTPFAFLTGGGGSFLKNGEFPWPHGNIMMALEAPKHLEGEPTNCALFLNLHPCPSKRGTLPHPLPLTWLRPCNVTPHLLSLPPIWGRRPFRTAPSTASNSIYTANMCHLKGRIWWRRGVFHITETSSSPRFILFHFGTGGLRFQQFRSGLQ